MMIKAKFPGACRVCGTRINAGDDIEWNKGDGAIHARCVGKPAKIPAIEKPVAPVGNDGVFPSKYDGTCTACGGMIAVGDMIRYSKETKATHAKCPEIKFVPPMLPDPDDAVVKVSYYDGEYLSAWMPLTCIKSLEMLDVSHYMRGWGNKIDDDIVKSLGESFTLGQLKAIAIPRLESAFNKKRASELEKQKKRNDAFDQARAIGQPVVLRQWSEECNDPSEECDIDNITIYAMPDGTTKKTRSHSW